MYLHNIKIKCYYHQKRLTNRINKKTRQHTKINSKPTIMREKAEVNYFFFSKENKMKKECLHLHGKFSEIGR